jgi:hypothetical protein
MRVLAKLLMFVGAYFVLALVSMVLKVPEQLSSHMAVGFLAALITWRLADGK